ncbi:hypothetical protein [Methylobacterium sp. CM6257]
MIRVNVGLCLILFGALHSVALAAQDFSQQRAECRKACVDTRLHVKSFCCTFTGGNQRGAYSCSDVKNESQYNFCIKGGERDEIKCSNDCNATFGNSSHSLGIDKPLDKGGSLSIEKPFDSSFAESIGVTATDVEDAVEGPFVETSKFLSHPHTVVERSANDFLNRATVVATTSAQKVVAWLGIGFAAGLGFAIVLAIGLAALILRRSRPEAVRNSLIHQQ